MTDPGSRDEERRVAACDAVAAGVDAAEDFFFLSGIILLTSRERRLVHRQRSADSGQDVLLIRAGR